MLERERNNISLDVTQQEAPFSVVNALKVVQAGTDPSWVSTREVGKQKLSYVSGDVVIRLLNKAFNYRWSYEVLETRVVESIDKDQSKWKKPNQPQTPVVQSLGRLTVPGWGVREQWGSQVILAAGADVQANAFKGAATDAMKKCASSFGIGLDLYGQQGMNELRVTISDVLTDDEVILGHFKEKIKKDKEATKEVDKEPEVYNHAPAEVDPNDVDDTPSDSSDSQSDNASVGRGNAQSNTQATPAPQQTQTPAQSGPAQQTQSQPASGWTKEDIDAMKALKESLGGTDNNVFNPYAQQFFGNPNADYSMLSPENIKDFLHFMSQQSQ